MWRFECEQKGRDLTLRGEALSFLFMINTHLHFHHTLLKTINHNPPTRYCDYVTTRSIKFSPVSKGHDIGYTIGLLSAQQVLPRPVTKVT